MWCDVLYAPGMNTRLYTYGTGCWLVDFVWGGGWRGLCIIPWD